MESSQRPHVLIITVRPVSMDLRVQRQMRTALEAGYKTTVCGFAGAEPLPADLAGATFIQMPAQSSNRLRKCYTASLLVLSKLIPSLSGAAFWSRPWLREARDQLLKGPAPDVIIGNNLEGLSIGAALQDRWPSARIIFDAHEYFLDLTTGYREALRGTMHRRITYQLAKRATLMNTVCEPLAKLYEEKLGMPCGVVYNAASYKDSRPTPPAPWDGTRKLRLVHHGLIAADRGQEQLVLALAHAPNCELHFHLVANSPDQLLPLKRLAEQHAPGRVFFNPLVKLAEIPFMVSRYDLGFTVIQPTCANTLNMLPNKFFEALFSGLGVVIGPSPAMRSIVEQYGCGVVAKSFDPADVGALLAGLTPEKVAAIHEGARRATAEINYDTESRKILEMIRQCLPAGAESRRQ